MAHAFVTDIELVPGQEPDGYDEEFATSMYVTFKLGGKILAALLNKQERVLGRTLEQLKRKPDLLMRALTSPRDRGTRAVEKILQRVSRAAKREITDWAFGEGYGIRRLDSVEFNVDSSWQGSISVDPRSLEVTFKDIELDVTGELITHDVEQSSRSFHTWRGASLQGAVVRLAHEKPELRPHLLPLVR